MANRESQQSDVLKTLGLIFGLFAGFVTLLYAVGGGVLVLRLFLEDLPSLTVVGQLPRELLISIGLTQIVLPALATGAAYATARLLAGASAPQPRRLVDQWNEHSWPAWSELVGVSALTALALTLLGAAPALVREGLTRKLDWLLAVALLVTLLVVLVALQLRAVLATRERDRWNTLRPTAWMSLIVAFAFLPACVVFAGTFHLLDAKVCTTSQGQGGGELIGETSGVLIGETGDRVYIGEVNGGTDRPRRVVSIPLGQVKEVLIGGEASEQSCSGASP